MRAMLDQLMGTSRDGKKCRRPVRLRESGERGSPEVVGKEAKQKRPDDWQWLRLGSFLLPYKGGV